MVSFRHGGFGVINGDDGADHRRVGMRSTSALPSSPAVYLAGTGVETAVSNYAHLARGDLELAPGLQGLLALVSNTGWLTIDDLVGGVLAMCWVAIGSRRQDARPKVA